jgi:uncharacterized protein YqhQ
MAETPHEAEEHFYGGQAVIEGVMMRGPDRYGIAVRRADGEVVVMSEPLRGLAVQKGWPRWPLVRGCYMLVESLTLGMRSLTFSADVMTAEEAEHVPEGQTAPAEDAPPSTLSRALMVLSTAFAFVMGLGLFVLLPTAVPRWIWGPRQAMGINRESILFNVVEGGIRLAVIVLYILTISLMKYVKRVFQYHGAEHATINCYEAGEAVTPDNCLRHSPLHPRCGTAFLLVVIVVKIILGCFLGWPVMWLRMLLRLALLPVVAAVAYEILRWAGRHRHSLIATLLAGPGLALQVLTTRRPDRAQIETAIYALAAVAPEVPLPPELAAPRRVSSTLQPCAAPAPADAAGKEVATDGRASSDGQTGN